jgi:hypothetical protein
VPSWTAGQTLVGTWQGSGFLLVLNQTGGLVVHSCAQGTVDEPVRLDACGTFAANAWIGSAGGVPTITPALLPGMPTPLPVEAKRLSGWVVEDSLFLLEAPRYSSAPPRLVGVLRLIANEPISSPTPCTIAQHSAVVAPNTRTKGRGSR